jgi:hypothetical protein
MPDQNVQGIEQAVSLLAETRTEIHPYMRKVFLKDAPMFNMFNRYPVGAMSWTIIGSDIKPTNYTMAVAVLTTDTTITLTDASPLQVGDVLQISNTAGTAIERIIITADPNVTTNVITVQRAFEGTTAVANTLAFPILTYMYNARTGSEINQTASNQKRYVIPQYIQTQQWPFQVGGLANAIRNLALPEGIGTYLTLQQQLAMLNFERSCERSFYFGLGQAAANSGDRQTCNGMRKLIGYFGGQGVAYSANANTNVNLAGGGSYTFLKFTHDLQNALNGGGHPDVVFCTPGFMTGLQTWGFAKQFIENNTPSDKSVGIAAETIRMPFLDRVVTFVPSYTLVQTPGVDAFFAVTFDDCMARYVRQEAMTLRGNQGDATQGDFIGDFAPELGHPGWHQYTEGITSFA